MSDRNPEYDFKWCPGCGDFGVRRALEWSVEAHSAKHEIPYSSNVIVAGIGCSGNMVHLLEGDQPFGIHGIHGRTLPIAFGIKAGRPELGPLQAAGRERTGQICNFACRSLRERRDGCHRTSGYARPYRKNVEVDGGKRVR